MKTDFDVIIVGASVAGSTAALLYANQGANVLVLEKNKSQRNYKKLCTHFIQPCSMRLFKQLGLYEKLIKEGALETKAEFWTDAGWLISEEDKYENEEFALNITREKLDPIFKQALNDHDKIDLIFDSEVINISNPKGQWEVEFMHDNENQNLSGKLVVCADGRFSKTADQLGNTKEEHTNDRFVYFAYYDNVQFQTMPNKSLFWMLGNDMAFIYPLSNNETLLSVYIDKERSKEWKGNTKEIFEKTIEQLPQGPILDKATIISPIHRMMNINTTVRNPIHAGVAFVGDAATALDPASGVGCSFAMMGAEILVNSTIKAVLNSPERIGESLSRYSNDYQKWIKPHIKGIVADSRIRKNRESEISFYKELTESPELREAFLSLTGRLMTPVQFQKLYFKTKKEQRLELV